MKKERINERLFISNPTMESIQLESGEKKYKISGAFAMADRPNGNNRIYPKEVLNKAIAGLRERCQKKLARAGLDHPEWEGKLSDVAAIITDVSDVKDDGFAYYEAQIIDTEKGKILKAILDAGSPVGVSTRGFGTASYEQSWPGLDGKFTVMNPGFSLESFDFVDIPSVKQTEDNVHLENKKETENMNLEQLRKEYPNAFVDLDKEINTLKEKANLADKFSKLIESIKGVVPEQFNVTQVPETDVIKAKESEITNIQKSLKEKESTIEDLTKKVSTFEAQQVKSLKDAEVLKIQTEDKDFFDYPILTKKFEACRTAEEVRECYNNNKELLKAFNEKKTGEAAPTKTQVPSGEEKKETLTESQKSDFNFKNSMRVSSGMKALTEAEYLKM